MKGKTITIPCPDCRDILARSIDFKGEGTLETKCVHCGKLIKIVISQILKVTALLIKKEDI